MDRDSIDSGKPSKEKNEVAEALVFLGLVILFFGLLACGFYARAHHIDTFWFWAGAIIVFSWGIWDRITD